jgi:hypothetical protein
MLIVGVKNGKFDHLAQGGWPEREPLKWGKCGPGGEVE